MRFLLDTHAVLAVPHDDVGKLGESVAALFGFDEHAFFASVVSIWEIAIKSRLGKLPLSVALERVPQMTEAAGIAILPISTAHALAAVEPVLHTRDPFDRLLLGVCQTEGLRLVTVDRALANHPLSFGG